MANPRETLFKALTDMRQTNEGLPALEKKIKPDNEQYPYGLEIRLEKNALDRLQLSATDFEPETDVRIRAVACVKSITVSSGDYEHQCVTLQIKKMNIEED